MRPSSLPATRWLAKPTAIANFPALTQGALCPANLGRMKLAVVGGGSTYSPELADGLARRSKDLGLEEIALTDIDAERLRVVGGFVGRMLRKLSPEVRVTLESSTEAAIDGADFVVTQIRVGGQEARKKDEQLGARFGVIGQETTGVGGFSKAMRTIPELLKIARIIEERAPGAVLINFTNPVSIVTQALLNHSSVNSIGLCNIPIGLKMDVAKILGVDPARVKLDSVGLNHLSFVRRALLDGKDVLPGLLEDAGAMREGKPANIPELDYPAEFITALGMIPSDYLRYFFLQRETVDDQSKKEKTRAEEVMAIEQDLLSHYADEKNEEKPASLSKRGGAFYSHAAIEVIEAIAKNTGDELVVDVINGTTVPELPPDAAIEVPCIVDARGARAIAQPPLEPSIRGVIQHVKAYEELTVRSSVNQSRRDAILALAAHPLVPSVEVAIGVVDEIGGSLGLS